MKQKITLVLLLFFCDFIMVNAQTPFWSDTFEDVGAPSLGSRTPSLTFECDRPPSTACNETTDLTDNHLFKGRQYNTHQRKY